MWSVVDMCKVAKNLNCPTCTPPAGVEQGDCLPSHFSSQTINKWLSHNLFSIVCFTSLHSSLVISLCKVAPRSNTKHCLVFLSTKGCDLPYAEITLLDKLSSDTSSSAVDRKVYVNESTISAFKGVFNQKHT